MKRTEARILVFASAVLLAAVSLATGMHAADISLRGPMTPVFFLAMVAGLCAVLATSELLRQTEKGRPTNDR